MLENDRVPRAIDKRTLVGEVPGERLAGRGFERHAIAKPRLIGEALEQRGDAAHPLTVQIGDAVLPIRHRIGIGAESEAVADEQNRTRRLSGRNRGGSKQSGDHGVTCKMRTFAALRSVRAATAKKAMNA